LNYDRKEKIGHKVKVVDKNKTSDEDDKNYHSMKVPFDPSDKDSKVYMVKSKLLDNG
jgi:hypothetical protein